MEITIYARKVEKQDKTKFVAYSTTLTKKGGSTIYARVNFNDGTPKPKYEDCPMNIIIEHEKASLSQKKWKSEGDEGINYTLWIKEWKENTKNPFRDSSLDDFV